MYVYSYSGEGVCRVADDGEDLCRQWKGVYKQLSGNASAHPCVQVIFHLEWSCNRQRECAVSVCCVNKMCHVSLWLVNVPTLMNLIDYDIRRAIKHRHKTNSQVAITSSVCCPSPMNLQTLAHAQSLPRTRSQTPQIRSR